MLLQQANAAAHHTSHIVPLSTSILFTLLLVSLIVTLAFEEKIHAKKSVIVGVFAVSCLFLATTLHLIPFGNVILPGGHAVNMPVYISAVDWGVIIIILGSSLFVDVTSRSGLFTWVAVKLTKASRGEPLVLLWYYGIMTVIFSAVLNNVTAMIIVGSLTAVSLAKLQKDDKLLGFLLIEGLLTNIGGLLTLISSVPNIIVGTTAGIDFVTFFLKASPYVLVATVATIYMGSKLFNIRALATAEERNQSALLISGFDENDGVSSPGFFWFCAAAIILFIIVIATTSVLPYIKELGMGFVALSFAAIVLIRFKAEADRFYKAIDWDLIGFFVGLFIVINVMEHAKVLDLIGTGIQWIIGEQENLFGTGALLVTASLFSSVTDNIPLAAMLAKILSSGGATSDSPLWWSVVFGANLGGNLTPIGSASTLVAVTIMLKYQVKMSFVGFVKYAAPYAAVQLVLAVLYVLVVLN